MANPGFLLAEDAAVKAHFSGFTVSDDRNATRPVKVFFRYPEAETEREYPFITIELIDVAHATSRQHSDQVIYGVTDTNASSNGSLWATNRPDVFTYWPDLYSDLSVMAGEGSLLTATEFIPVDIMYQVSTYTRSALHDRQLTAKILSRHARFRWGFIDIPEDGTIRRFDLLDWVTADLLDPEAGYRKRIFRKIFTIQMNAELTADNMTAAQRVLSVTTTITDPDTQLTETVTTI